MPSHRYTTAGAVTLRLGQLGVDLHTDDGIQAEIVSDCIDQASGDAEEHFAQCYDLDLLYNSGNVNGWVADGCTDLAVYYICFHRLNIPNEAAAFAYERTTQSFNRVRVGCSRIPNATRITGS